MTDLNKLYQWFQDNRAEIIRGHENQQVLIKDNEVVGYYPTEEAALLDVAKRNIQMGDFLIQECIPEDADRMVYYNQAVYFG